MAERTRLACIISAAILVLLAFRTLTVGVSLRGYTIAERQTRGDATQRAASTASTRATAPEPADTPLTFNTAARIQLAGAEPYGTTLHVTIGSIGLRDFVENWLHYARLAGLSPLLVGALDKEMLDVCTQRDVAAVALRAINAGAASSSRGEPHTIAPSWRYFRHHASDFISMGVIKTTLIVELLQLRPRGRASGFSILLSDADVVWLRSGWQRWMEYAARGPGPLPEAVLLATADVLVSTDELDADIDALPVGDGHDAGDTGWLGHGMRGELNTGVLFFRGGAAGALAFARAWRRRLVHARARSMPTNDQPVFNELVRSSGMSSVLKASGGLEAFAEAVEESHLQARVAPRASADEWRTGLSTVTRDVFLSTQRHSPCGDGEGKDGEGKDGEGKGGGDDVSHGPGRLLSAASVVPPAECAAVRFSLGTLPPRAFPNGHIWFFQRSETMEGHALPRHAVQALHLTYSFGDTADYPYGKRQRAREAGLWSQDSDRY